MDTGYLSLFCCSDCISRNASSRVIGLAFFLISSHTFSGLRPSKGLKMEAEPRLEDFVFLCDMLFDKFQFCFGAIKPPIRQGTHFTIKRAKILFEFLKKVFYDLRQVSNFYLKKVYCFSITTNESLKKTFLATKPNEVIINIPIISVHRNRFPNSIKITPINFCYFTLTDLFFLKIISRQETKIEIKIKIHNSNLYDEEEKPEHYFRQKIHHLVRLKLLTDTFFQFQRKIYL